jgi:hypothetical protein
MFGDVIVEDREGRSIALVEKRASCSRARRQEFSSRCPRCASLKRWPFFKRKADSESPLQTSSISKSFSWAATSLPRTRRLFEPHVMRRGSRTNGCSRTFNKDCLIR